jgi:hypothetical protein
MGKRRRGRGGLQFHPRLQASIGAWADLGLSYEIGHVWRVAIGWKRPEAGTALEISVS